jgi:DNA repair protein RecO (recombination protein O)
MIWDDKGFLLSKFKYSENSVIADFFTTEHGKSSGIIFGASSKRIKGYLQIGNKFQLNYQSKNENKIGSFKVEIIKAETPLFFNDRSKLHCISSSMSMVKLLTAENQKNPEIFNLIEKFFMLIKKDNWLMEYIIWELELLKLSGYDLNLSKIVKKTIENNKSKYFVESQTEKKIVPNFLVENNNEVADKNDLIRGIQIVTSYLDKNILQPNNLNHPLQRVDFINTLK